MVPDFDTEPFVAKYYYYLLRRRIRGIDTSIGAW